MKPYFYFYIILFFKSKIIPNILYIIIKMIYKNTKKRKHFNKFMMIQKEYKAISKKTEFGIQNLNVPGNGDTIIY